MNRHCLAIQVFYTFLGLFLLASLIIAGCEKKKKEAKQQARAFTVITGKASTRRVEYVLNQVGTLEASQDVTLRSEIDGRIVDILFEEGQEVEKGQVLVRLDPARIQAEIRNLEARIHQIRIRLENKTRTLQRHRSLVKRGVVSQQQFEDLQSEIKEIKAQIIQAQADLARQKELLSYTEIRAPFYGITGARNFSLGHYLKTGDPIVTIVNLDPLEITFHVPEKFKSDLHIGQDVLLSVDAYPEKTFKGKLFFISPKVDVDMRAFQVKARVRNNRPFLNPGMFARIQMITEVHESAIVVPWESVIQTEDETYIYVLKGDVAQKVPVSLGKITSEWAEILDPPLSDGETIILEGKFAVKDGMKVAVREGP